MLSIKILGSGCPNCQRLEQEVRASLKESDIDFEVIKVTDFPTSRRTASCARRDW